MKTKLIRIGNSQGIRIPKPIIEDNWELLAQLRKIKHGAYSRKCSLHRLPSAGKTVTDHYLKK